MAEGAGGLSKLDLCDKGSRRHIQRKLRERHVEEVVVLFQFDIPLHTKQGIEVTEASFGFFYLEIVANRQLQ